MFQKKVTNATTSILLVQSILFQFNFPLKFPLQSIWIKQVNLDYIFFLSKFFIILLYIREYNNVLKISRTKNIFTIILWTEILLQFALIHFKHRYKLLRKYTEKSCFSLNFLFFFSLWAISSSVLTQAFKAHVAEFKF